MDVQTGTAKVILPVAVGRARWPTHKQGSPVSKGLCAQRVSALRGICQRFDTDRNYFSSLTDKSYDRNCAERDTGATLGRGGSRMASTTNRRLLNATNAGAHAHWGQGRRHGKGKSDMHALKMELPSGHIKS